jgi:hypothetical protein
MDSWAVPSDLSTGAGLPATTIPAILEELLIGDSHETGGSAAAGGGGVSAQERRAAWTVAIASVESDLRFRGSHDYSCSGDGDSDQALVIRTAMHAAVDALWEERPTIVDGRESIEGSAMATGLRRQREVVLAQWRRGLAALHSGV